MTSIVRPIEIPQSPFREDQGIDIEQLAYEDSPFLSYSMISYGADYPVNVLYDMLIKEKIVPANFQRKYVWTIIQASQFIESLLFNLPVPGVILSADKERSGRLLIVDGQQRLLTLKYFLDGEFPKAKSKDTEVFKLVNVNNIYAGMGYEDFPEELRDRLNNYVIHTTIITQNKPIDNNSSLYFLFERLNSGGRTLTPQEIRSSIYHGRLLEGLNKLKDLELWKNIYGEPDARLRDVELILRFFAFLEGWREYERPVKTFINKYCDKHKDADGEKLESLTQLFKNTLKPFSENLGKNAFRINSLNAAFFDSAMVGVAERIRNNSEPINDKLFLGAYNSLKNNEAFIKAISVSTSLQDSVNTRFSMAIEAFNSI